MLREPVLATLQVAYSGCLVRCRYESWSARSGSGDAAMVEIARIYHLSAEVCHEAVLELGEELLEAVGLPGSVIVLG